MTTRWLMVATCVAVTLVGVGARAQDLAPPGQASTDSSLPDAGEVEAVDAGSPTGLAATEPSPVASTNNAPVPPLRSPSSQPAPSSTLGVVSDAGARGFGFTSADGQSSLFIHWLVQADYLTYLAQSPAGAPSRDTFTLGFAGLQLDATLAGIWHSSVLVDFSQSRLTLLDAFVEARFDNAFVLRVGKFETPLTEERLTPKFLLPWISTNPASFLLPVREIGAQILGDLGHGVLQYNLALVNGSYAGAITDNDIDSFKDGMGRIAIHPLKRTKLAPVEQLGLGVGASVGDRKGNVGTPETPVFRTYGNATFFSYKNDGTPAGTVVADGIVARVSPEVTWAWGPVAAFADYVHEVDTFGSTKVLSDAWGVTATLALTGEDAGPFSRIVVKRPWRPSEGHFGGVQLVAGGGTVHVSSEAFTDDLATPSSVREADILGAGINWYPINGFGVLVDYSYTTFHSYEAAPVRTDENTIYGRCEFHM